MEHRAEKESKKKREQYMIEIRKSQNDIVFKSRRMRGTANNSNPSKNSEYINEDIERESYDKFMVFERELLKGITTNDKDIVITSLTNIRLLLSYYTDPNLVPWLAFFKTMLFDIISVNLKEKNYYNNKEIKKEALWYGK